MTTEELHPRQRAILNAIPALSVDGVPPSLAELGAAVGLRSSLSTRYHLEVLEKKGLVRPRVKGRPRSIVLTPLANLIAA